MTRAASLLLGIVVALVLAARVHAQVCPTVPADAFAFINPGSDPCPTDAGVRWTDAQTTFDCSFLASGDTVIDCSADPSACVDLCRAAANIWNTDLPGRFKFNEATKSVTFCDTEDGVTSVGGTTKLCDGTSYGQNVLAVTLSIFFSTGSQKGQLIDANITVNQAFRFSQAGFRATVAHELGHALGLSHPDQCGKDFNVLMRSASLFAPSSPCFVLDPTSADLNGAQRIYALVNPTPTPTATPGICGDADQNGTITVSDGVNVLRAAAGLSTDCTTARCDVDASGGITVTDGVNVLRGAAGLQFTAHCP